MSRDARRHHPVVLVDDERRRRLQVGQPALQRLEIPVGHHAQGPGDMGRHADEGFVVADRRLAERRSSVAQEAQMTKMRKKTRKLKERAVMRLMVLPLLPPGKP